MFQGGTSESPAIYTVTYLGMPDRVIGYLEIVEQGDELSTTAYLIQGAGWPIEVPDRSGVVYQRVATEPAGDFPEERSSQITDIESALKPKNQVPDGGFEIGKHENDGWMQYGLMLNSGEPDQTCQLGITGTSFPIATQIGWKFRIIWRDDIRSSQKLFEALDRDLGDDWSGFEFAENYD